MSSALLAGVSGLQAHQEMIDVVGNDLANLNTTGFKAQRTDFADLVYGGQNPVQIGIGVQTEYVSTDFAQGSLQATGNNLDLAIQGNGFFVVNSGNQIAYTRAGSFVVDQNNYLVDPATGASRTAPGHGRRRQCDFARVPDTRQQQHQNPVRDWHPGSCHLVGHFTRQLECIRGGADGHCTHHQRSVHVGRLRRDGYHAPQQPRRNYVSLSER